MLLRLRVQLKPRTRASARPSELRSRRPEIMVAAEVVAAVVVAAAV
jgi:hypothetical protein